MFDSATWRRNLARALTREAAASVREILDREPVAVGAVQRIGVTGPPGAGKSSLIAALAQKRLNRGRSVGVLAIDPTSPTSGGSILGDRIRMDALSNDARLFVRSAPSGPCHDGLCRNVVGMMDVFERAAFDDLILETVGVGQINYEARALVDTFVLVLVPESGDTVQAMKAGILETADIYVVNKADLPGAQRLVAELRSVLRFRAKSGGADPAIIPASTLDGRGVGDLGQAIDARYADIGRTSSAASALARSHYQLRALLIQRLEELSEEGGLDGQGSGANTFDAILRQMRVSLDAL